jgi:branched-chain amino acid aminotransferase
VRSDGGLYDAKSQAPLYFIQTWPLESSAASLNENGLQLCIFPDGKKITDRFCNIKHNNYLPYFMGALYAKEQQCNDAIILNNYERICDSTIANIFIIKNDVIFTPSLAEGCVAGVMRKFILKNLPSLSYSCEETAITLEFLLDADEVFLSNSIYNMRWVSSIGEKKYTNKTTRSIFEAFVKTNPLIFC